MKYEWRKKEKEYYLPKSKPEVVDIKEFKFIQLSGEGNPNSEGFSEAIGVLYLLAYAIKMMPRNGIDIDGYYDYVVYPLEGLWDLKEEARGKEVLDKDKLVYTLMIRQPDFVTEEVFNKAMEIVKKKKPHRLLDNVNFESREEGKCVQMMHIGSFDDEAMTFEVMKKFCNDNNLEIKTLVHREIYISDFRKTATDKLKTVLRYRVR
ncbi:GyrI-like domain-containing protein [Clostridium sp. NSJ-6]|uniref:GyrI-like domain-containing protein n=1 Tax=Clostridium hominis TaxID=2763036 RepID=A0ABR7DE64_9CLOT|nr:GyrI-like domain-containing protein [Clostridium hominis]MBC5629689.1 GyrI-like domain-containing protein [Clostridium hominis]